MTVIAPHRQPIANMPAANNPVASTYVAPVLHAVAPVDPRDAARTRVDQAMREGFQSGYDKGHDRAQAEIAAVIHHHNEMRDRFVQAAHALEAATAALARRDQVALESIEADTLELAIAIATELVGRELAATPQPVRDAIARALRLVPDRGTPVARVHPDDAEVAREVLRDDPRWAGTVDVVADVRVEQGGCLLEVGDCRIDAQVAPALDRLRQSLGA
jgi:flagellar biosynthesis/type III secretory pathway protein FliH